MGAEEKFVSMQNAAKSFVDMVDLNIHRIGIVSYESKTSSFAITNDRERLKEFIEGLSYSGTTATDAGIRDAMKLLTKKRRNASPVIILMTDGEADSFDSEKEAAEDAKAEGDIFYTVALLGKNENPDTSVPNQQLADIATNALTHHYVLGAKGLLPVYQTISRQIGEVNPRDVRITQTIGQNFELVDGSWDDNIPKPSVEGETLVWEMRELMGKETLHLSYQIRIKDGTGAGWYPHTEAGTISYTDNHNKKIETTISVSNVHVLDRPPVITSLSKNRFDGKGGERVTITGENFTQKSGVKIGTTTILDVTYIDQNTLEAVMPGDVQGEAELTVVNKSDASNAVTVSFYASPLITEVKPARGIYEGGTRVKVRGRYFMKGATVTFNGTPAAVVTEASTYIYVDTPFLNQEGPVSITVTNPDQTTVTMEEGYTYEPKVVPPSPQITGLSVTEGYAGTAKEKVKISGRYFRKGGAFRVELGDYQVPETELGNIASTYIYFNIPDTLQVGSYDLTVTNDDGSKVTFANAYTCKEKPPLPSPQITKLSVTSGTAGVRKENVKISGRYFRGENQFCVKLGNYRIPDNEIKKVVGTYIYFNIPETLPAGTYDVTVTNDDGSEGILKDAYQNR